MSERETYLGDGLYCSWDGWQVKLRAPREGGDHVVFLEDGLTLEGVPSVSRRHPDKETELIEPDVSKPPGSLGGFLLAGGTFGPHACC
jgi:hypothetical protein